LQIKQEIPELKSFHSEPEIYKWLEAGGDGLVNDKYHKGAEDGLEIYRSCDEQVHGLFFK
jgi:hypothetical protein